MKIDVDIWVRQRQRTRNKWTRSRISKPWPLGQICSTSCFCEWNLLEHSHIHVYIASMTTLGPQWQSWVFTTKVIWPAMSENLLFSPVQKKPTDSGTRLLDHRSLKEGSSICCSQLLTPRHTTVFGTCT